MTRQSQTQSDRGRESRIVALETELQKLYAERPTPTWAKIVLVAIFALMAVTTVYLYANGLFPPAS